MALDWTALAMVFFPAAVAGREKATHLQLVVPTLSPIEQVAATDGKAQQPPPHRAKSPPLVVSRDFQISRADAVAEFVNVWVSEVAGGGPQRFRTVAAGYADLATDAGWPAITDKALSVALQEWGCVTETGARQKDGSRPTIVTFPDELTHRPRRSKLRRKARK